MDLFRKQQKPGPFGTNLSSGSKHIALQQLPVAEHVFRTQLLLEIILGNLKTKELLELRSLSHAWNAGAYALLCKRKSLKIEICFPNPTYVQFETHNYSNVTTCSSKRYNITCKSKLELLTETIASSGSMELDSIFPHCQFQIYNPNLRSAVAEAFVLNCGHTIQNFCPRLCCSMVSENNLSSEYLDPLIQLCFNNLPNLRQLSLHFDHRLLEHENPDHFQRCLALITLPKLKLLEFDCETQSSLINGILQAAVNLEEIHLTKGEHFREATLDALISQGKSHLVSSLNLSLDEKHPELVEKLVKCVRIKSIKLDLYEKEMSQVEIIRARNIANNLITWNAHILERLHMDLEPIFLFRTFQNIPPMPKLRSLQLTQHGGCGCVVPFNGTRGKFEFKMSVLFPQLKALRIDVYVCERLRELLFEDSFMGASFSDQVPGVKSIYFFQQPREMCMRSLPHMFSNLVFLHINFITNIPQAFEAVWRLSHLQILKLRILCYDYDKKGKVERESENLDQSWRMQMEKAMTGFSEETLMQLALQSEEINLTTVEPLRVNRSMLDLKNLREMHMKIYYCFQKERPSGETTVLSRVTGQFAFKMCPTVQIFLKMHASNEISMAALKTDVDSALEYVTKVTQYERSSYEGITTTFLCPDC